MGEHRKPSLHDGLNGEAVPNDGQVAADESVLPGTSTRAPFVVVEQATETMSFFPSGGGVMQRWSVLDASGDEVIAAYREVLGPGELRELGAAGPTVWWNLLDATDGGINTRTDIIVHHRDGRIVVRHASTPERTARPQPRRAVLPVPDAVPAPMVVGSARRRWWRWGRN